MSLKITKGLLEGYMEQVVTLFLDMDHIYEQWLYTYMEQWSHSHTLTLTLPFLIPMLARKRNVHVVVSSLYYRQIFRKQNKFMSV